MSLIHSIRNVRKPIGSGCSRTAYYSKKYDVVIKKSGGYLARQSEEEARIFALMEEDEKEFFPMISLVENCIIMKRCKPLNTFQEYLWVGYSFEERVKNTTRSLSLDEDKIIPFIDFCNKYHIGDMHLGNIGVLDNHLVVIDAGW